MKDASEFQQFNNFLNSTFSSKVFKLQEIELDSKRWIKFKNTKLLNNLEVAFSHNSNEFIIFARKQVLNELTKEIDAIKVLNILHDIKLHFEQNEVIHENFDSNIEIILF